MMPVAVAPLRMTGVSSDAILCNVPLLRLRACVAAKCALLVAMYTYAEDASVTWGAMQVCDPYGRSGPEVLWHYTTEANQKSILSACRLEPSRRARNPRDARYGDGQYLTDIAPGTMPRTRLAWWLVRHPGASWRFTHYIALDVTGLDVVYCRKHVFLIPNWEALDLTNRIVSSGANWDPSPGR